MSGPCAFCGDEAFFICQGCDKMLCTFCSNRNGFCSGGCEDNATLPEADRADWSMFDDHEDYACLVCREVPSPRRQRHGYLCKECLRIPLNINTVTGMIFLDPEYYDKDQHYVAATLEGLQSELRRARRKPWSAEARRDAATAINFIETTVDVARMIREGLVLSM